MRFDQRMLEPGTVRLFQIYLHDADVLAIANIAHAATVVDLFNVAKSDRVSKRLSALAKIAEILEEQEIDRGQYVEFVTYGPGGHVVKPVQSILPILENLSCGYCGALQKPYTTEVEKDLYRMGRSYGDNFPRRLLDPSSGFRGVGSKQEAQPADSDCPKDGVHDVCRDVQTGQEGNAAGDHAGA